MFMGSFLQSLGTPPFTRPLTFGPREVVFENVCLGSWSCEMRSEGYRGRKTASRRNRVKKLREPTCSGTPVHRYLTKTKNY